MVALATLWPGAVAAAAPAGPARDTVAARGQDTPPQRRDLDAEVAALLRSDPALSKQYRSGAGMMIGGGVSLGLGVGALLSAGVMAASSAFDRFDIPIAGDDDEDPVAPRPARRPELAVAGVGLAAVIGGAALLAIGATRRDAARRRARARVALAPAFAPAGLGGFTVGVGASGRF